MHIRSAIFVSSRCDTRKGHNFNHTYTIIKCLSSLQMCLCLNISFPINELQNSRKILKSTSFYGFLILSSYFTQFMILSTKRFRTKYNFTITENKVSILPCVSLYLECSNIFWNMCISIKLEYVYFYS